MLGVLIEIKIFQIHEGYSISVYGHDTNKLLIQQKNKIKKPAIAKISKKNNTFNWNQGISSLRELGNNQIKELPPGVFNNNTELIKLCVIDFLGSCHDSLWCAKILVSLLTKCDQEGPEA